MQPLEKDSCLPTRNFSNTPFLDLDLMRYPACIDDAHLSRGQSRYECFMVGQDLKYTLTPGE